MKRTLIAAMASLLDIEAGAGVLEIRITDIRAAEGSIMMQVVDSEAAFDDQAPAAAQLILPAREPDVALSIDALPPGDYAMRVFHDVDGNGELDTNLVGMPAEPWGFSNDASGSFGPPSWRDARFVLGADGAEQHIRLNH